MHTAETMSQDRDGAAGPSDGENCADLPLSENCAALALLIENARTEIRALEQCDMPTWNKAALRKDYEILIKELQAQVKLQQAINAKRSNRKRVGRVVDADDADLQAALAASLQTAEEELQLQAAVNMSLIHLGASVSVCGVKEEGMNIFNDTTGTVLEFDHVANMVCVQLDQKYVLGGQCLLWFDPSNLRPQPPASSSSQGPPAAVSRARTVTRARVHINSCRSNTTDHVGVVDASESLSPHSPTALPP